MQIKGLHLVIRVLEHLVEPWPRRCAVTRAVRYAIETPSIFDRTERIYIPLLLSRLFASDGGQVAHGEPVVRRHRDDDSQ